MATFDSTVIARLATGLYSTQIGNATMAEALAAVNGNAYGSVDALANALYARDFAGMTNAAVADMIVKNVGLTGALATEGAGVVQGVLDGAAAVQKGAAISNLLTSFSTLTAPAFASAVSAFNHQVHLAVEYAQTPGTDDQPLSNLVARFSVTEETGLAGLTAMRLAGNQDVRIDFTNPANQITGLDLDNDGLIEANGVENRVTGMAANYGAVDAYARNPWNHTDSVNNFLGDIAYDGTGFQGDGVRTNGNVFLGGLGVDTALGGVGNDFLAGGGVAQGRVGADRLSGGRNSDFFFVELSLLSATDGNSVVIDGGTTSDNNAAGSAQSTQDSDWLLLEVSDDDEPVTVALRDDTLIDPTFLRPVLNDGIHNGVGDASGVVQSEVGLAIDRVGYVITRAGVPVGTLRDVENFDASGNLYGFLNNLDVQIGGRAVDDRDAAGTSNYGIGSSAQLRVVGSNVGNIIIGSYDNDLLQGADGNDLMFGGNMKQFLETVTGGVTNPNMAAITNDGRDELWGGSGNDNLVFEADGAIIDGDNVGPNIADVTAGGTSDTLWLTKYALGTGTAATVTTDGVLRFDLTSQNLQTEGAANEGAAGYGGSNTAGTQDQTNYVSAAANRVSLTNMENVDATGLGAIDYFAAGSNTPSTQVAFTNHQNFDGYNGNLTLRGTNGPTVLSNTGTVARDAVSGGGNNQLYAGFGNDIIEGRGNNAPVANVSARTQFDDLEGNRGNDDFYISIAGDFTVGGASGGGLGGTATAGVAAGVNASAGDGYDVIRRKIDANNDGFWDQNPAAADLQNPSSSPFVWGQDFGLDADSTSGASVLTIDIQKAGGNTPGLELGQVVNAVTAIVTGVKQADGSFKPVLLNAADISAARTYGDLLKAIQDGLKANTEFGADLTATLDANGHKITISDAKGRELADAFSEGGAGVAVQQLANTATENVFAFGPATVSTVQDRLIYKAYEDRTDNEGVDDNVNLGSTVSLGADAYAQDLVVSFQRDTSTTFGTGTTTFIAEDQNWQINFDNLTTQDRVSVAVNSVTYTLQVGVQLDGTIIAIEDTNSGVSQATIQANFLARLAGYINSFSDNDTAAGSVQATSNATQLTLLQNTYNGEQTVYMRAPVVTIENLSGGQSPSNPVWFNPATGAGPVNSVASAAPGGIVNASQSEVQLYQFDGRNNKLNTENVKFWGQEEVQRSVLASAKDTGGALDGIDSWVVDGEANTIRATGDLAAKISNTTALITPALDAVDDRLVTTNSALNYNFAAHGDDLLITGPGVDNVRGGTGDDRVIGSVGSPLAPVIGAVAGGETLDGGKNLYAVKLIDEADARVYVLNRWEAAAANIATISVLPELAGRVISSITPIGQTETGSEAAPGVLKVAASGTLPAGTFSDTLQYQQEDFGASARFTITLDDFVAATVAGVTSVQTPRDGAGLVSIDANGDGVAESFARFANFENVRTVSGTGAANAPTAGVTNSGGQGNDTLNVSALSTATGGISYDLTDTATAGNVNFSADAHAAGAALAATASADQRALGLNRPQVGDFETNLLRVDGVENVIGGLGDDLVTIDETEAAKNNTFIGDLGDDRIDYVNAWTAGVVSPAAEPVVTINVNAAADTDTVVMTGGRLGTVVATDTLTSVEYISLNGFTAAGQQERDVLNVAGVASGAVVNYNDLIQSSPATVTPAGSTVATAVGTGVPNSATVRNATGGIEVTIENLFDVERVVGGGAADTVIVADAAVMGLNEREDVANLTEAAPITMATWIDYDTLFASGVSANKRVPFIQQTTGTLAAHNAVNIEWVVNNGQFGFNLAGGSDTVDYSAADDAISVVVELDETRENQFVLVDADGVAFFGGGTGDMDDVGDRIDVLANVERIVASRNESVLDLTSSTKGLEIKWSAFDLAARVGKTTTAEAYDVFTVRIADLTSGTPLTRTFLEYRADQLGTTDDPLLANRPTATWNRVEGSDNAETIVVNSAHSLDNDTFNLRGGTNTVKYNELTRSIITTLSVQDFDAANPLGVVASGFVPLLYASNNLASATQQLGTVMAVTQFQNGDALVAAQAGGQTHVATSHTGNNGIAAGSLRIAASQDAEDVLVFQGLTSKLFVLSESGTTDNQITVRIGSGATQNSVVLTGYEFIFDSGSADFYDFSLNANGLSTTLRGVTLVDQATADHDGIKVPDEAINFNGSGANTIDLDNLSAPRGAAGAGGFEFDFDVLDITAVTKTNLVINGGTNAAPANADADATDEVILGQLVNVNAINDFEGLVLTQASLAAGSSFSFSPAVSGTAGFLTQGGKTIPLAATLGGASVSTLSFGGTALEGTYNNGNIADVTGPVTVKVEGAVGATVIGGAGADTLTGGGGADRIAGRAGNDVLDGGFSTETRQIQIGGAMDAAAGSTVTVNFTGAGTGAITLVEGSAELAAGAGGDAVGAALAAKVRANLTAINTAAQWNNGASLVNATYSDTTDQLVLTFSSGVDVTGSITIVENDASPSFFASAETTVTQGNDGGSDTFVFANTAAANGTDTINNFVAAGLASDDVLEFDAFLGGVAVPAAAVANFTNGLSTLGATNFGVVFNKAALSSGDIALAAAAGKIAVEDNGKAVILVTADADGVVDAAVNPYLVYYVQDTNTAAGAQTYTVTQVATLNSLVELSTAEMSAATVAPPVVVVPTLTAAVGAATVNEGATATFTLNTTGLANGTVVNYVLSGAAASAGDTATALAGTVVVNNNTATLTVNLTADNLTEGVEALTATFTSGALTSAATVTVLDTSTTPAGGFTPIEVAGGTTALVADAAVAENFIFDFKMVGGRATVVDGNVTITGFSTANDKLTFNDTGAGTLLTEAQFKVLLGVSIAENPFANETTISMDPDGVNTGSVKLVGIVDAALNQIVVETTP